MGGAEAYHNHENIRIEIILSRSEYLCGTVIHTHEIDLRYTLLCNTIPYLTSIDRFPTISPLSSDHTLISIS